MKKKCLNVSNSPKIIRNTVGRRSQITKLCFNVKYKYLYLLSNKYHLNGDVFPT